MWAPRPDENDGTRAVREMKGGEQDKVAFLLSYFNFARIHSTLRVTPAMQAGMADHVWSLEEIVELLDATTKMNA